MTKPAVEVLDPHKKNKKRASLQISRIAFKLAQYTADRHNLIGMCIYLYINIHEGKLESRPTVTRLSLGCLILVRSLI